jgi:signal transduction histidine kinase
MISVTAAPAGDNSWLFAVSDNGIGIAQKHYERIFEPFKRLHGTEKYQGSGLGLATCKKIVERHGGMIRCESRLGEGSSFLFTLQGTLQ